MLIGLLRGVLLAVAKDVENVCSEPAPRVRFRRFEASGIAIELLAWVPEPWMRGRALDALNTRVYKRFAEEGIEIPFPQRTLHLADPRTSEVLSPSEES